MERGSAFRTSADEAFPSRYSHLYDVEPWLPCSYSMVFRTEWLNGDERTIGSSVTLFEQLRVLNERTWKATASDVHIIAGQNGMQHPVIEGIVELVDGRLASNRKNAA